MVYFCLYLDDDRWGDRQGKGGVGYDTNQRSPAQIKLVTNATCSHVAHTVTIRRSTVTHIYILSVIIATKMASESSWVLFTLLKHLLHTICHQCVTAQWRNS